jgi:CRP-like cAMP-binding protein
MLTFGSPKSAFENCILASLPHEEFERLRPRLDRVRLTPGRILYGVGEAIRYAYFPMGGMLSLVSTTRGGASIEVGMIGNEGVAGLTAIMRYNSSPYLVMVQIAGNAARVRTDVLREEFDRRGMLSNQLLRYAHTLLTQVSQSAACNRFHTLEQRLSRWLLICRDRTHDETISLTQEFLSYMLGVPRTSVTAVAADLQRAGLISYSRGKIRILDRGALAAASCECYEVISESINHFLAA